MDLPSGSLASSEPSTTSAGPTVQRKGPQARFLNRRPEQTKAPTQNCFPKVLKDLLGHDREHTDFPFPVILSGSREEANLVIDPLEVGLVPSEYHMAISSLLSAQTRTGLEMMEDDGAFEGRDLGAARSPR